MNKNNGGFMNNEQVKSTCNSLEVSPSKNAQSSKPVYVAPGSKSSGKGGMKKGK